jgi:hypothetical protein
MAGELILQGVNGLAEEGNEWTPCSEYPGYMHCVSLGDRDTRQVSTSISSYC